MLPITQKVDIFTELDRVCDFPYELFVIDGTIQELKKVVNEQSGKNKEAAKISLELIKSQNIKIINNTKKDYVDNLILNIAQEKGYFVATQDKDLKSKLKNNNVQRIFLRQKKYLIVEK